MWLSCEMSGERDEYFSKHQSQNKTCPPWQTYQHSSHLGSYSSGRQNNCTTCCMTCIVEQQMREERASKLKNKRTCNYTNDSNHQSVSKYDSFKENDAISDEVYYGDQYFEQNVEDSYSDEFEMELDNDFKKFLEQSAKHKEERKKQKQDLAKAETHDYIEVNEIALEATTMAPTQQQGLLRSQDMKRLYGSSAHYIESLETSLQLHFNMNVDMRHPVFWPSIPLKF